AEEAGGAWRLLEEVMQGRCPFGCLDGRPVVTSATHAPEPAVRPGSAGCPRCPGLGYAVHMGSGMPIIQQTVDPRRGRGLPRRGTGFSLIELMVVVAVVAILAVVAYPSLTSVINSNRLSSNANELVASLQYARSEA